jgi:arabinofuranosyltransferase
LQLLVATIPLPSLRPARRALLACALMLAAGLAGCSDRAAAQSRAGGNLLAGRAPFRSTHAHRPSRLTDGVRARNGSAWDYDLSTVVKEAGGVEWDLGAPERIGAISLQADNNDDYVLMGSLDGVTWTDVWTAPRSPTAGQQVRESNQIDTVARFVRIEPRAGDGGYALTEVALYHPSPSPWPPTFAEARGIPERVREQRELGLAMGLAGAIGLLGALAFARRSLRVGQGTPAGAADSGRLPALLRDPAPWLVLLNCALLVATALVYRERYQYNTIDDAYISFQYAKNWISGHGVVFNPGQRVEGYTNFLWVALLAPLWPLSGHDPMAFTAAASYLTMLLACLALLAVAGIGRRCLQNPMAWLMALLLLAFDDAFVAYTVFALENQLLIACMLGGLVAFVWRKPGWEIAVGISFALVAMTRPDGVLWAGTFVVTQGAPLLWRGRHAPQAASLSPSSPWSLPPISARSLGLVIAAFVLPYGAYFAWRYSYYGYLLPNTFYLKVGSSLAGLARGWDYLRSYITERGGAPLLALLALVALDRPWVRWLGLYALIHAAYVVYVGGDFYSGHRFLMALGPVLGLLAAAGVDELWRRGLARPRAATIISGAVAVGAALAVRWGTLKGGPAPLEIGPWGDVVNMDVREMQWLGKVARPDGSMVLGDIGCAGFFANLRVVDVYGVVDPKVAHRKVPGFGTGKPGHEKVATPEELLAEDATYIKWGFVDARLVPPSRYYLFNDFPPDLHIPGLFVRDDRGPGQPIAGSAFHFDAVDLATWSNQGDAFAAAIAGTGAQRDSVVGNRGPFIDTLAAPGADRATGRLLSPAFAITGDSIRLLVGGGRDPQRLRVSLLIDGRPVRTATGSNAETLGRRVWDVRAWKGKNAQIEIVDQATEVWGHLLVDEIEQWPTLPPPGL